MDDLMSIEDDSVKVRRSPYKRYKERLINELGGSHLQDVTLLEWLQDYNFITCQIRPNAAQRVIQYFPRYVLDPTSA
jgi:endo-1,4-beta-mannosidase